MRGKYVPLLKSYVHKSSGKQSFIDDRMYATLYYTSGSPLPEGASRYLVTLERVVEIESLRTFLQYKRVTLTVQEQQISFERLVRSVAYDVVEQFY